MKNALNRIKKALGEEIASKVLFRERSFVETFPINNSGKRDIPACQAEGITEKTISINPEENIKTYVKK